MGESHPGWTLPSHEGEDEYQDTTSAHREREQRAPTSNRRQHHHGQRRSRNVSEVQTSGTMKDRRRCVVGDRGCSVLWQGFGGSTHFKRRQTRQPVSPSARAKTRKEVAWGAGEIALGRPFSLLRRPCSQTDPSDDPLAVQSGFWMPS